MFIRKNILNIESFLNSENENEIKVEIKKHNPSILLDTVKIYIDMLKEDINPMNNDKFQNLQSNLGILVNLLLEEYPSIRTNVLLLLFEYNTVFALGVAEKFKLNEIIYNYYGEIWAILQNNEDLYEKVFSLYNMGHYIQLKNSFRNVVFSHGGEGVVMGLTEWNMFDTEVNLNKEKGLFKIKLGYNVTLNYLSHELLIKHFGLNNFNEDFDTLIKKIANEINLDKFQIIEKLRNQDRRGYIWITQEIIIENHKQVTQELIEWVNFIKDFETIYFEKNYS